MNSEEIVSGPSFFYGDKCVFLSYEDGRSEVVTRPCYVKNIMINTFKKF